MATFTVVPLPSDRISKAPPRAVTRSRIPLRPTPGMLTNENLANVSAGIPLPIATTASLPLSLTTVSFTLPFLYVQNAVCNVAPRKNVCFLPSAMLRPIGEGRVRRRRSSYVSCLAARMASASNRRHPPACTIPHRGASGWICCVSRTAQTSFCKPPTVQVDTSFKEEASWRLGDNNVWIRATWNSAADLIEYLNRQGNITTTLERRLICESTAIRRAI
jgi:hypothetical protein